MKYSHNNWYIKLGQATNTKGESVKMNKMKKVFVLLLIVAVVSLGLTGCKGKSEPPPEETPSQEHPTEEHPTGEHPK